MWQSSRTHAAIKGLGVLWLRQENCSTIRLQGIAGSFFSISRRRHPGRSVEHRTDLHQVARNQRPPASKNRVNAMGRKMQALRNFCPNLKTCCCYPKTEAVRCKVSWRRSQTSVMPPVNAWRRCVWFLKRKALRPVHKESRYCWARWSWTVTQCTKHCVLTAAQHFSHFMGCQCMYSGFQTIADTPKYNVL